MVPSLTSSMNRTTYGFMLPAAWAPNRSSTILTLAGIEERLVTEEAAPVTVAMDSA